MLGYRSTQFSSSTNLNFHDSSYVFNEEKGFYLAVGIVDIVDYTNDFEEYFDLKLYQSNFDITPNGVIWDISEI